MTANETQIGGDHYKKQKIEHWDWVAANDLDYFQGNITKYVSRWRDKGGLQDLEKARHYLDKYIEVEKAKLAAPAVKLFPEYITVEEARIQERIDPLLVAGNQRGAAVEHRSLVVDDEKPYFTFPEVDPLGGWVNYQFEGCGNDWSFWRCRSCHRHFKTPYQARPDDFHPCRLDQPETHLPKEEKPIAEQPTAAYVDQG